MCVCVCVQARACVCVCVCVGTKFGAMLDFINCVCVCMWSEWETVSIAFYITIFQYNDAEISLKIKLVIEWLLYAIKY